MKILFSICLILLMTFFGCKPLDVEPQFEIPAEDAFNNVNDLEVMINGAYQSLQSANCYGAAYKMIPDIFADFVTINDAALKKGRTGSNSLFNVYQRQTYGAIDNVWRESYTCINRCNVVIDAIITNKIKDKSGEYQSNANRILGEAYCLRGLMHFELLRLYAHQFGVNENVPNSGILLMIKPTLGRINQPRATTKEVYEQVQTDLTQAAGLLPIDKRPTDIFTYGGRKGGRATKYAALALLARVYFQKATDEDDVLALKYANEVINDGSFPLDADTGGVAYLITSNLNSAPSVIFQVVNLINPITNEANSTSKTLLDSYYYQENDGADFPTIYLLNKNFNGTKLAFTNNDLRIQNGTVPAGELRFTKKYQGDALRPAINVPIIRLAELVLMRAELSYAINPSQAVDDVFQIRENAYGKEKVPNTYGKAALQALSSDSLLKTIINERIIELNLEGDRLHHFKRIARRYGNPAFQILKSFGSKQRNILPNVRYNDNQILFQIPDAEISTNPLVVRNP